MLAIKVYNAQGQTQFLDLQENSVLSMEELMPAFDTGLEQGEFSLPISVPMTDANRRFLGFPEHFNTAGPDVVNSWRCDVYADGIIHFSEAILRLLSFQGRMDASTGTYSFNVSGLMSHFGKAIKGKNLRDLKLGGQVSWDLSIDCRTFAKMVMEDPGLSYRDKFVFPPVIIEDYFDTTRDDYNNELLANDTVNNIVYSPSFPNGWLYGVENPLAPGTVLASGNAGYQYHRTVPFFRLTYVLKQCFQEFGWKVGGSFFSMPEAENLLIYNNCSLEKYDPNFPVETGRQMVPSNHMPDLTVYEFLKRIQNAFNLKITFPAYREAQINFREAAMQATSVKDLSEKVTVNFLEARRNDMFENGFVVKYDPDSDDATWSDRVKDPTKLNVVATVNLYSDIPSLSLPTPDGAQFIYVSNENYYYTFNEITYRWEPYSEGLWENKSGKGQVSFELGFSPLCEHYSPDGGGAWTKRNIVSARQTGGYINCRYKLVQSPFNLRLFFFRLETTLSYTDLPRSYCHNYNADGTKIGPMSLSLASKESLFTLRWWPWIKRLQSSWELQAKAVLSNIDLASLSEQDLLLILQNQYLIRSVQYELPLRSPVTLDLVKL